MMDIFAPPVRIYFDFFAIASSSTRTDECLIHPSVATHFNTRTLYRDMDDVEKIVNEFITENLSEKILQRHHLVRSIDSSSSLINSNVHIERIICLWCFIDPLPV